MESKDLTNILAGAVLSSLAVLTSGCYEYYEHGGYYGHDYYRSYPQRQFYYSYAPRPAPHHYNPRFNHHSRPFNNLPYGNPHLRINQREHERHRR